jgi:hypothetical protein
MALFISTPSLLKTLVFGFAAVFLPTALPVGGLHAAHRLKGANRMPCVRGAVHGTFPPCSAVQGFAVLVARQSARLLFGPTSPFMFVAPCGNVLRFAPKYLFLGP